MPALVNKQRRVSLGDERRAWHGMVPMLLKILDKGPSEFVRALRHEFISPLCPLD